MFTTSDDYKGGRRWRWWPYFWWRGPSIGVQQQLIVFEGKPLKPFTVRVYSIGVEFLPWKWKFGLEHVYYDGPHHILNLGLIWFYWDLGWCKVCEEE